MRRLPAIACFVLSASTASAQYDLNFEDVGKAVGSPSVATPRTAPSRPAPQPSTPSRPSPDVAPAKIPLEHVAAETMQRARKNFLAEMDKGVGMNGIRNSLNQCYAIVGHDIRKLQYCYALHYFAEMFDTAMMKRLKMAGNSPGFTHDDVIKRAGVVLLQLGYPAPTAGLILKGWRLAMVNE